MLDLLYVEKYRIPKPTIRKVLTTIVERIELDPKTRVFKIKYRLPVKTGVKVASPRGFEPRLLP